MFLRTLLSLLPFHFLSPQPAVPITPQSADEQAVALRVVELVNAERKKEGCPALTVNAKLTSAAQRHSLDMDRRHFFAHADPDGLQPWDRMHQTGYRYHIAAENIGAGYTSPEAMVTGWMKSPGHRENILTCDLAETGVGYVFDPQDKTGQRWRYYWTQDFATGG